MRGSKRRRRLRAPFLQSLDLPKVDEPAGFPFSIPAFRDGLKLDFTNRVSFLVGENGSGKSTLLEAIAEHAGFNLQGGNRNHVYGARPAPSELARALQLAWMPKVSEGFFLRAESFFNFASYVDLMGTRDAYGGKSLHEQSHGESFLALFRSRFRRGLYLLDEPEAALSPMRQLTFVSLLHSVVGEGESQFIIATHSPIILSYPDATILELGSEGTRPVRYEDTEQFQVTRDFLLAPERFLRHLLGDSGEV